MARKTKEDAERTYHALLDAATKLFIQRGVAKTTLNDIATAAGMTRGAVYWHFDNKDAVILALWERNAGAQHRAFREELTQLDSIDPAGYLRSALFGMIQKVVEEPKIGQAIRITMHNVEFTEEKTELQRFLQKKREDFHVAMENAFTIIREQGQLKSELPSNLLAHALISYLFGLLHNHLEPGLSDINLKENGQALLNLFFDSILAPSQ